MLIVYEFNLIAQEMDRLPTYGRYGMYDTVDETPANRARKPGASYFSVGDATAFY